MSDDIVIRAEGLGKKYIIGHEAERERYVALRDVLMRAGRNAWRKTSDLFRGRDIVAGDEVEEFWALKDVSFEVKRGEVLGIIGRNGAGKSTLLKVLSRITEPSEGRVTIKGRVASLLEVGTGFHPELTGRENIYLNGAVLGMTRAEIKRKFDEIVAFAEVEKFLDTPVKRYSSGMYVRLAFAVAAHLEPEILIVDEVLAVGDAEFQKKSLGKMQDVAGHGRTVLFVSHNMAAVQRLCAQGILLQNGQVVTSGKISSVMDRYLAGSRADGDGRRLINVSNDECRITSWSLLDESGATNHSCLSRDFGRFRVRIESHCNFFSASLSFVIRNLVGDLLLSGNSNDDFRTLFNIAQGTTDIILKVRLPLKMGRYQLEFAILDGKGQVVDHWVAEPLLTILPCNNSALPIEWHGLINEPATFEIYK